MSLGTRGWRHAEREAAEDTAGEIFLEGGTPRWRATFQGLQSWTTTQMAPKWREVLLLGVLQLWAGTALRALTMG